MELKRDHSTVIGMTEEIPLCGQSLTLVNTTVDQTSRRVASYMYIHTCALEVT